MPLEITADDVAEYSKPEPTESGGGLDITPNEVSQFQFSEPVKTSSLGAATRSFVTGVVPAFGAYFGAKLGESVGAPVGAAVGALVPGAGETGTSEIAGAGIGRFSGATVGALIGSVVADKSQRKLLEKFAPDTAKTLEEYQQSDYAQHPLASFIGNLAAGGVAFKFAPLETVKGISSLFKIARGQAVTKIEEDAARALAIQSGMGVGLGVVSPLIEGQAPTARGITEMAAQALLLGHPRFGSPPPVSPLAEFSRDTQLAISDATKRGQTGDRNLPYQFRESPDSGASVPIEPGGIGTIPPSGTVPVQNPRMRVQLPKRKETNASAIASPESLSQPEIRPRVGQETSLRQPGEVAPAQEEIPQTDEAAIKEKLIRERIAQGIPASNLSIVVQSDPSFPQANYVQVDENHPTQGNVFSSNPEQMNSLGFEMPTSADLLKLPAGKYTLPQAMKALAEVKPVEPPTPELSVKPGQLKPATLETVLKNSFEDYKREMAGFGYEVAMKPRTEPDFMGNPIRFKDLRTGDPITLSELHVRAQELTQNWADKYLPTESADELVIPPSKKPTVHTENAVPSDYSLLDAVKEHGNLGGPSLDSAMKEMSTGTPASVIAARYGEQYHGLTDIFETAYERYKVRKNDANYNRFKKAYEAAGLGDGGKQIDTTHKGITDAAQNEGKGFPGGIPGDQAELIARAWQEAQNKVSGVKPKTETKSEQLAEADKLAAPDQRFQRDITRKTKTTETLVPDDLQVGDSFVLNGAKLRVTEVSIDPDTQDLISITLDDGKKYGTQVIDGKRLLRMDVGSLESKPVEFLPEEKPAPAANAPAVPKTETAAPSTPAVSNLPQKYQVRGRGPQTWTLIEKLKAMPVEIANGEQPVRIRNDKTGEEQTFPESNLKAVKSVAPEEKAAKAPKLSDAEQLIALGVNKAAVAAMTQPEKVALLQRMRRERKASGQEGGGISIQAATQAIHDVLGTYGGLPSGIVVLRDETAPWAGRIDDRNRITINAAQISSPIRAQQVIIEEGLHGVWESPEVQRAWRDIKRSVSLVDIADERISRESQGLDTRPEVIREEAAIAKLIERHTNRDLVTKLLDAIRTTFKKVFKFDMPGTSRQQLIDAATNFLKGRRESIPGKRFVAENAVVTPPGISPNYAITAYHGTPHKVDKFSTSRIGSGEGAQVYGWGLYMAENPQVAADYARKLGGAFSPSTETLSKYFKPGNIVPSYGGGRDRVISFNQFPLGWSVTVREVRNENGRWVDVGPERTHMTTPTASNLEKAGLKQGNEYTVTLHATPDELLDWDKPFGEQSPKVQAALQKLATRRSLQDRDYRGERIALEKDSHGGYSPRWKPNVSGAVLYHSISEVELPLKDTAFARPATAAAASEYLADNGIKGVRYLDQGSRQAARTRVEKQGDGFVALWGFDARPINDKVYATREEAQKVANDSELPQTYNYVIFNDADISITHENGVRLPTSEAVNNPPNASTQFAVGDVNRYNAINRELNTLNEKETRTPAEERRVTELQRQLGQMDLAIGSNAGASGMPAAISNASAEIAARQGKRLIGGDITTQGDLLDKKPMGQQTLFGRGDVKPTIEESDKPERQVAGQVSGVPRVGQMDIQESIANVDRRIKNAVFDGKSELNPENDAQWWRVAGEMTNQETKGQYAKDLADTASPAEGDVREIAPARALVQLMNYAVRKAIGGDDSMMRMIVNRSRDFGIDIGGGRSTAGRTLRGLRSGADDAIGLFKVWESAAKLRAASEGERLGVGVEKYNQLIDALNNAKLSEDDWMAILDGGKTADGRSISDVIESLTGLQSKTTRETLELEREMIGLRAKNEAEARRWMNRLENLQTEWRGRPEKELSVVRQIVKNALDLATEPARDGQKAGISIWEDSSKFTEPLRRDLEANGVSRDAARRLSQEIWRKAVNDFSLAQNRAIARAAKGGIGSLIEAIQTSPQALQNDPKWLKETAENWLMSNGLSREQAQAVSGNLVKEFQAKLQQAREKIARQIIDRGPPKSLDEIIAAIRAGLTNPDQTWSDKLAERGGWKAMSREDNQKLAQLELKLGESPSLPERIIITNQMISILRKQSKLPSFMDMLASNYSISALTAIRTHTIHLFAPMFHLAEERVLAAMSNWPTAANLKTLWQPIVAAGRRWWSEYKFGAGAGMSLFPVRELESAENKLRHMWESGSDDFKSKDPKTKAIGLGKMLAGSQDFGMRLLNAANQANVVVVREAQLAMYGSEAFRMLNLDPRRINILVEQSVGIKEQAYTEAIDRGLTKTQAMSAANDIGQHWLEEMFGQAANDPSVGRKIWRAAENDALGTVGRLDPTIDETDEGGIISRLGGHQLLNLAKHLAKSGPAGQISKLYLLGYVAVPYRMARFLAWNSYYGLARLGIHQFRQSRGWDNWWKQSLSNEYQARYRLRMALAASAVQTLLFAGGAAFLGKKSTADEDAGLDKFGWYVTGLGPTNKTLRDAWTRQGFRPESLTLVIDKHPVTLPLTRVGESLGHLLWPFAATDDLAWRKKEAETAGRTFKESPVKTLAEAVGNYAAIIGQRGPLQQIIESHRAGGSPQVALASAAGKLIGPVVPFSGLQRSVRDLIVGQVDYSTPEAAFAAAFPVVGWTGKYQAINRFGDPLYDHSWYSKMAQTGVPVAFRVEQNEKNKDFYTTIVDKGAAPPPLSRALTEDKYGQMTQDQWNSFAKQSGDALKQMVLGNFEAFKAMEPQEAKKFLSKAAGQADSEAAANVGLERLKPVKATPGGSTGLGTSLGGQLLNGGAIALPGTPKSAPSGLSRTRSASGGPARLKIAKLRTNAGRIGGARRISLGRSTRSRIARNRRMRLPKSFVA